MSLPMTARPRPRLQSGVCRVCGCTDDLACHGGCSWVEPDLCSRCHGRRRPTRAQTGELGRIRERLGPFVVRSAPLPGCIEVVLVGTEEDRQWRRENGRLTQVLVLDGRGHVVARRGVRT